MNRAFKTADHNLVVAFAFVLMLTAIFPLNVHAQTLSVVHNFAGGSDGGYPVDGLTANPSGVLFGTRSSGGTSNNGTIFKLNANNQEVVLHSFAGGVDGASPNAAVIRSKSGVW